MVDLSGTLFVNEFMAENDTTLQDPDGTGYPDWFELYNAGSTEIDLQGLYLTDDLTDPTQHAITQTLTDSGQRLSASLCRQRHGSGSQPHWF